MSLALEPAPLAAPAFDPARAAAFTGRVIQDLAGAMTALVCAVGDRAGLFGELARSGPATPAELAGRAGTDPRLTEEWLRALACAGYLQYDGPSGRFRLPPEHAGPLAGEGGPMFVGGAFQQVGALAARVADLGAALHDGGAVPQEAYGEELRLGMERMSAAWFDGLLVPHWLSLVPHVRAALERGARFADLGCGGGRALAALARAFPASRFWGFDRFAPAVERARENLRRAGVDERVEVRELDVAGGLPGTYDVIATFDSLHDFTRPAQVLEAIRSALEPGGSWLVLEMNAPGRLEESFGPIGAILYATSVLYNTPVARALGGEAHGTMGITEQKLREMCAAAGFGRVDRLPLHNPFNVLYEVRP